MKYLPDEKKPKIIHKIKRKWDIVLANRKRNIRLFTRKSLNYWSKKMFSYYVLAEHFVQNIVFYTLQNTAVAHVCKYLWCKGDDYMVSILYLKLTKYKKTFFIWTRGFRKEFISQKVKRKKTKISLSLEVSEGGMQNVDQRYPTTPWNSAAMYVSEKAITYPQEGDKILEWIIFCRFYHISNAKKCYPVQKIVIKEHSERNAKIY